MDVIVRTIKESDIDGFLSALTSVINEREYLLTLDPPTRENALKFMRNIIENNDAQYVAELNGEIIGWADILPKQLEALRHVGTLGIGIVAQHRGKGVGKQLLKSVIAHAWQSGLTRLELEVFASNANAIGLYEKFGFVLEGTKVNARLIDGRYRDVHFMAQCRAVE